MQSYLVKLLVAGNNISLHFYNTNHKIIAQSKEMTSVFYDEVFLPFLEKNCDIKESMIKKLNDQIRQGKGGEKRQNPTGSKTNFTPHAKKAHTLTRGGRQKGSSPLASYSSGSKATNLLGRWSLYDGAFKCVH